MSSNLKVNTILPSVGTAIGIGTAGGSLTISSNTITAQTEGSQRVGITSDGKVGIGTDNPLQALHILRGQDNHLLYLQGGDTICDIVQSDNGGSTRLRSGNGYFYIWTGGDGNSSTGANGSPAFRLDPNLEAKFYNSILVPDKIEHDQDSDTAIRFPAYDTVSVETGGSERLRINSSGISTFYNDLTIDTTALASSASLTIRGGESSQAYLYMIADDGDDGGDNWRIGAMSGFSNRLIFYNSASGSYTDVLSFQTNGTIRPGTTNVSSLGTSSLRWSDVYTNDLHLSNQGSTNSIDNTWGDFTIQEGESDLFLINNRNGKKYKFNLTEVS